MGLAALCLYQESDGKIYAPPTVFGPAVCELQGPGGKPFIGVPARVDQYVMAYSAQIETIRRRLPPEFAPLRPVLRINAERLAGASYGRIELNAPVASRGKKGWLNLVTWKNNIDSILYGRDVQGIPKLYADISAADDGKTARIQARSGDFIFLGISHERAGVSGGCPKEDDNESTFHCRCQRGGGGREIASEVGFMAVEPIDSPKEYCHCTFCWQAPDWPQAPVARMMLRQIAAIENRGVLGAYVVRFDRMKNDGDQIVL